MLSALVVVTVPAAAHASSSPDATTATTVAESIAETVQAEPGAPANVGANYRDLIEGAFTTDPDGSTPTDSYTRPGWRRSSGMRATAMWVPERVTAAVIGTCEFRLTGLAADGQRFDHHVAGWGNRD